MSLDIVYVSHNRRLFSEASFQALLDNTAWDRVNRLHIRDDASEDGTLDLLIDMVGNNPVCPIDIVSDQFGGPVNALNSALDSFSGDFIAKIDSDVIVCPSWLDQMLDVLQRNPTVDALGMEPGFGDPVAPLGASRYPKPARWIGGVFLARAWCFRQRPVMNDRWWGLTQHWRKLTTAWITPALPVFLLDHIEVSPWRELAAHYIEMGWARAWEEYFTAPQAYYDWWLKEQAAVA